MGNFAVVQSCMRISGLTLGWHTKVIERRIKGFHKIIGSQNQFLYELI